MFFRSTSREASGYVTRCQNEQMSHKDKKNVTLDIVLMNVTLDMNTVILDIVLNRKGVKALSFNSNKTAFDQSTTTNT